MANELVMLKLGGSLITDKSKLETLRKDDLARLAKEIHEAKTQGKFKLIVGHGGGSFPHRPAHEYGTAQGFTGRESAKGVALVADAAARLNRLVVKALINAEENAVSFQPSALMVSKKGDIEDGFSKPIEIALDMGILPVPYGDICFDTAQGCAIISTEKIIDFLSSKFPAKRIVIAGIEDGVWEDFPKNTKLVEEITPKNFEKVKLSLQGSANIDVTGGMLSKVEQMLELAMDTGTQTIIVNGKVPGRVRDALLGKKVRGTVIRA